MTTRIHIPIDEADKARYRRQAELEGKSLAAWLRDAAEERIRAAGQIRSLRTTAALDLFFGECDARETGTEPDWEDHRRVIERSRGQGLEVT